MRFSRFHLPESSPNFGWCTDDYLSHLTEDSNRHAH
jgi:hypothetical protein